MMSSPLKDKSLLKLSPWVLVAGDALIINVGYILAFLLRFGADIPRENFEAYTRTAPWITLVGVFIFQALGLYAKHRNGFASLARAAAVGVLGAGIAAITVTFWMREFSFPRGVMVLAAAIQIGLVLLWRGGYWYLDRWLHGQKTLLVIADPQDASSFAGKIGNLPLGWYRVYACLPLDQLEALATELQNVDGVLVGPSLTHSEKAKIVFACLEARKELLLVPDLYDILLMKAQTLQLDDFTVVEMADLAPTPLQAIVKRALDVATAGILLIPGAPLMLLIAAAIRFSSKGPILYFQERVGQEERVFPLYKFRTMVDGAENETGPVMAAAGDPRITPVGRFLRTTRLDELPQLINVLKGDMSLIGPRPERPHFVEQFNRDIRNYRYRHVVKPGVTGLAQVAARYTTSPEEKLRYDLYYVRNWSFLLDLQILLRTIPVVLSREQAQGHSVANGGGTAV